MRSKTGRNDGSVSSFPRTFEGLEGVSLTPSARSRISPVPLPAIPMVDPFCPFTHQECKKIPYPTLKGIKFILDEMAERQPLARKAAPENFVDLSLLQEIEQSGSLSSFGKTSYALSRKRIDLPPTAKRFRPNFLKKLD
jgi:hypothetical protein